MKKPLLWLGLAISPWAYADNISEPQIVGNWHCEIRYERLGIRTLDNLDLQQDHTSVGTGLIIFNKYFIYESKHTGVWALNDNILSETSNDYTTIKIHPDSTMKRLNSDNTFKQSEQRLYQQLIDSNNSGKPVKLKIGQFTPQKFEFLHLWENGESFPGFCIRKKDK